MKRVIILLLISLLLLCGCNKKRPSDSSANSSEPSTDISSFLHDTSTIDGLTDFQCYASYNTVTTKLEGNAAKSIYKLISASLTKQDQNPAPSSGGYVYLVFFTGEDYRSDPTPNKEMSEFWGAFSIYGDGLMIFSESPYHSAAYEYNVDPNLYNSIMEIVAPEEKQS